MIGRCRAASTWTPIAFIATSIAPLPKPDAKCRQRWRLRSYRSQPDGDHPGDQERNSGQGDFTSADARRRAVRRSAWRGWPRRPPQKSMIAICVASMPSLSRSEGSEPPKPPITVPLATNIKVTAIAAVRLESWLVTVAVAVIRSFCIDLVESPTLRMMDSHRKAGQLRQKRTCTSVPYAIHTLQHLYRVGGARARAFLRAPR